MATDSDSSLMSALRAMEKLADHMDASARVRGDLRSGRVYIVTEEIVIALKVALLTGRPLLLGGPPGCGKSSLASYVARNLDVAYHEFITTDEARSSDLTWHLDAVRRLGDAQAARLTHGAGPSSIAPYIEPGPLWWALNPESAATRGLDPRQLDQLGCEPASAPQYLEHYTPSQPGAVLLIDEIDKADSAFCNGLLVPLGSHQDFVPGIDYTVRPAPGAPEWSPLTFITTNNERDLPEAFLRRCIVLRLPSPDASRLVEIVRRHFSEDELPPEHLGLITELAGQVTESTASSADGRPVSTAEFIDLVNVVLALVREPGGLDDQTLNIIKRVTLNKNELYGRRDRMWSA